MENIVFEQPHWKAYFASHGLHCFEDFFDYRGGDTVNRNSKRNVIVLTLSDGDRKRTFYMKRFFKPHLKDMIFTVRSFGRICSQAELEYRNANMLLQNGIETYHPACYGYRTVGGIERRSFFMTEKINGRCLLDYLIESWEQLSRDAQENLVIRLGRFFKEIHAAGISLPDAYVWHVYMVQSSPDPDDYEFGIIDLHRMRIHTRSYAQAAMNLGRFLFSLPDGFMNAHLQNLFTESYLSADFDDNKYTFINEVRKWEAKLLKRRKKPVNSLPKASLPQTILD